MNISQQPKSEPPPNTKKYRNIFNLSFIFTSYWCATTLPHLEFLVYTYEISKTILKNFGISNF